MGQTNCSEHNLALDQTNLKWQTFNGSIPNGAVSIYNVYVGRTDYVAKCRSEAGFYNPDKGPYCFYPYYEKEHRGSPFEILVNKDNVELLEWKDGFKGSVPYNAVKTSPGSGIYVGKNEYGLGKVDVKNTAFFLPYEGKETWYKTYKVLTVNKDVDSEEIFNVKKKIDDVKVIKSSPETLDTYVVTNNSDQPVKETTTLSKTTQKEERWNNSVSVTGGVKTTITTGIPFIAKGKIELSAESTYQYTKGATYTDSTTRSLSVEANVPPKHSCCVNMVGYKNKTDVPYTAQLKRTYKNKKIVMTSISGTYSSVEMGEVWAVVDRCQPI